MRLVVGELRPSPGCRFLPPFLDGLVLVLAPEETRRQRLIERRGMSAEEAQRRIKAQVPPERKRPLADWVIDNDASLDALYAQVDQIAEELKRPARTPGANR